MKWLNTIFHKIGTQKGLFYLFLGVLILPNVFLFFTESMPILAKLVNIILPLGAYWFVFSLIKKPGKSFWALFLFVFFGAFQIVLLYLFGEAIIAVDMFLNLINTNPNEAFELLNNLWPGMVFVIIVYVPSLILAIQSIRKKETLSTSFLKKQRKWALSCTSAGIALLIATYTTLQPQYKYEAKIDLFPVNVCYNAVLAVERKMQVDNYYTTSEDFQFHATTQRNPEEKEVYIFVIGETGRALNWSLYGYDKPTNPLLEQIDNLLVFPDAITESNTTHKSVPLLLSAASAQNYSAVYKQKSIVTAFKEAGFETLYCSNHRGNNSYIDFYAAEADETIYLKSGLPPTANVYDLELEKKVKERLAKGYNKLFIVLHSYGSHFNYFERYPNSDAFFHPDNETRATPKNKKSLHNAYDNTIRYTDMFLARLIDTLSKENVSSALLYTSDHGEDIFDDKRNLFLHASPVPSYYQLHVPFLIWMSNEYKEQNNSIFEMIKQNQKQPISTNLNTFHTLLSIGGINTPFLESDYSLATELYNVTTRYYLNDHCKPKTLDQIGLKKLDFEMFDKMSIHYNKSSN